MKNLKSCLLLLFIVGVFASSCKKDDGASTTELLTHEGGWTVESVSDNTDDIIDEIVNLTLQTFPEELRTPELEVFLREGNSINLGLILASKPCEEDNTLIFNTDGTVTELFGTVKCNSSESEEATGGSWSLTNGDNQLTIIDDFNTSLIFQIGSISSSRLDLEDRQTVAAFGEETSTDFTPIENIDGFQDLMDTEIVQTYHLQAN